VSAARHEEVIEALEIYIAAPRHEMLDFKDQRTCLAQYIADDVRFHVSSAVGKDNQSLVEMKTAQVVHIRNGCDER
jgi:hypothetical protein